MCHHGPGPGTSLSNLHTASVIQPTNLMVASASTSQLPFNGLSQTVPPLCNPCSSNNFNSTPLPALSRWGPRTSCPVHSPFRVRVPNGSICSGHQVNQPNIIYKYSSSFFFTYFLCLISI